MGEGGVVKLGGLEFCGKGMYGEAAYVWHLFVFCFFVCGVLVNIACCLLACLR